MSFDDNYVFTVGNDCALIIYEIKDKEAKIKIDKDGMGMQFAEEFLIPKESYKKKINKIEKLKADVSIK